MKLDCVNEFAPTETLALAEEYQSRGWAVTPVAHRTKRPILKGWQQEPVPRDYLDTYFGTQPTNIGIVLGSLSNGLTDVDLDHPRAIDFAEHFLPSTACVFGRASNPKSHRIYVAASAGRHVRFEIAGKTILEVRGSGCMTVFPGSIHQSGEQVRFEDGLDGDPSPVDWTELIRSGLKIAVAASLRDSWIEGTRHQLALSASGFLLQLGWTKEDVCDVISAVSSHGGDVEADDRLACVETTHRLLADGRPVSARSELEAFLDQDSIAAIARWSKFAGLSPRLAPSSAPTKASDLTTDSGAADAFAEANEGSLIFRDDTHQWFGRRGQVFRPITTVQVQDAAKLFMQDQVTASDCWPPTRSLLSKAKINNLIDLSRHSLCVDPDRFDNERHLVGCADGSILNLTSGQLEPNPDAIITKALGCRFDPSAGCTEFERFLEQIFDGNSEVVSFVQRAAGYSLSGHVNEQCLFMLVGRGSNGKSTLLNTLLYVLGDYGTTTPAQTLTADRFGNQQTNDLAKLVGVRFVAASETEHGQRLAESKIKRITGGDRIACRELYGHPFDYDPHFKIWLATNDAPAFSGGDFSIARRIRVIQFPVSFAAPAQDHRLQERLLKEAPGILNWMVQGYRDWTEQGLNSPNEIDAATKSYRTENDSVGQFIDTCCIRDPKARVTAKELYAGYEKWCQASSIDPLPKSSFGKELKRQGLESIKARLGNGWIGLSARESD